MSKMFVIKFSDSKDKIDFPSEEIVSAGNGLVGYKLTKGTRKDLELQILGRLFKEAMNNLPQMDKVFECKDCLDQVKDFNGGKSMEFTKDDMDHLMLGFTKTADRRPDVWMEECFDLFKQIKDPVEKEIKKTK